jgi:fructose-1-phosphate kinase PfkB-like protein
VNPILTVCLNPVLQKTLCFSSVVPGTVNRTRVHRLDVSGKGVNVTRVLTQLGKTVVHLTQLGGVMRPLFLSLCEQDKLDVEWVESKSQIRFCYTMLTESNGAAFGNGKATCNGAVFGSGTTCGCVTELVEESEAVGTETEQRLFEKFDSLLTSRSFSWLIISGTKAAGFSNEVIPLMVKKAKEKGVKVILDIKGKDLIESLQYSPDIIKPNLYEFADTFTPQLVRNNDFAIDNPTAIEQIKSSILDVCKRFGCRVVLTDGSRKILAADSGDNFFEMDIQVVKAVNTIGCGDAFTAGLTSALEDGKDFRGAITEGIRCGALNAGLIKPGVIK